MKKNNSPKGWDWERVRRVLAHYDEQTEDEAGAEDEAAFEDRTQTLMEVPKELVPAIRALIAKRPARFCRTPIGLRLSRGRGGSVTGGVAVVRGRRGGPPRGRGRATTAKSAYPEFDRPQRRMIGGVCDLVLGNHRSAARS